MFLSNMEMLLLGVVLVLLGLLLRLQYREQAEEENLERFPYIKRNQLLNTYQQQFLQALQRAVGDAVDICPRVRGADVVKTMSQLPAQEYQNWQEQLLDFSFDYVLLDRRDYSVVGVVDLQIEETPEVIDDDYVRDLCHAARLPFVRFQANDSYNIPAIRSVILAHLPVTTDTSSIEPTATTQEIGLICPACSSLLVRKKARNGKYAGQEFWACSSAPRCRHAEHILA